MATKTVFDHAILTSKAMCVLFLREFGVSRDWARVNLPELRTMLRKYPDEKMFEAAKRIVERDGDTFDRADFEVDVSELDDGDVTDVEAKDASAQPEPESKPESKPATKPEPKPAAQQSGTDAPDVSEVASLLAKLMASGKQSVNVEQVQAIAAQVVATNDVKVRADMAVTIAAMVDDMQRTINEAVKGVAPREIVVRTERSEVRIDGLQHFMFEDLLRACSAVKPDGNRHNIWLYGPPGTGKTTAAANVAKALDLSFYCTGSLLTKYDIVGFVDANGKLVRTPFREAWENGGVFLFDEIDGSAPAAVLAFNAALANGIMAFPDGMVARHKDCVVIAAANTTGLGATAEFNGRVKLDSATLDRYEFIEWPIDEKIEAAMSNNAKWTSIVQKVRANVAAKGIKGVCITPRATIAGCSLLNAGLSIDAVTKMVLRKAMSPEQWAMVAV